MTDLTTTHAAIDQTCSDGGCCGGSGCGGGCGCAHDTPRA